MDDFLFNRLENLFTPCKAMALREQLSLSEKGKTYLLKLRSKKECTAYHVDGDIIRDKRIEKCDYLVLVRIEENVWIEIFVELKGADIRHAIHQLECTLTNPLFLHSACLTRNARIVSGNHIPANTGNSNIERAKIEFKKKWNCNLQVIRSKKPDNLLC